VLLLTWGAGAVAVAVAAVDAWRLEDVEKYCCLKERLVHLLLAAIILGSVFDFPMILLVVVVAEVTVCLSTPKVVSVVFPKLTVATEEKQHLLLAAIILVSDPIPFPNVKILCPSRDVVGFPFLVVAVVRSCR